MTTTTEMTLEILKQDRKGRIRTPREKREAMLDEYERSGMSGPEFAQYHGIKYQTLATWVQKRRKGNAGGMVVGKGVVNWMEAEVGNEGIGSGKPGLVVEVAGGARFSVGDEGGAILAATVLRHLGVGPC